MKLEVGDWVTDVKPLLGVAAREHVSLKDSQNTVWFCAVSEWKQKVRGVAGTYFYGDHKARVKGVWVHPEYRGEGVGTLLTEHAIKAALDAGVTKLDVIAIDPRFYLARGWKYVSSRPNGGTVLKLDVSG